jgi:hypothetical protein
MPQRKETRRSNAPDRAGTDRADALTRDQITAWERAYDCALTDAETNLLTGAPGGAPTDGQKRHVLTMFMQAMECPACQHAVPPRVALGRPVESGTVERDYTCPHCHRGLQLAVPVIGQDFWRLTVPLGPQEATTDPGADRRGQCEFCHAADVALVAVLSADPDQAVCEACNADPRLPTVSLATVSDDRPVYVVSRGDLARMAGRAVTDGEAARIAKAIDNSTAMEAIGDAVWQVCGVPDTSETTRPEEARNG